MSTTYIDKSTFPPKRSEAFGSVRVWFTTHAVDRLGERCWGQPPGPLNYSRLEHIFEHAELTAIRPPWLHPTTRSADAWLVLGDVAFPLCVSGNRMVAVTCLTRGSLSTARDRRTRARARRQADRERTRAHRHALRCGVLH